MAQASGSHIELRTDLDPELPHVEGNDSNLRTALTNLIFNAVDAMPEGGTLTLSTKLVGESVQVGVSDTGVGMTDQVRTRALEPFFTTKGEGGTGLGLAMVYGIAQWHGGDIDIESRVGKGSTVTVRLPALRGTVRDSRTTGEEGLPRSLHILVAEDDPDMQELLGDYLTRDGHTVESATDGQAALMKFQEEEFDLVMTDRGMPIRSGDQLAVAIRANSDTPIIMLTGFGSAMVASGERPPGVDFVLSKPVSIAALRKAIVSVLKG